MDLGVMAMKWYSTLPDLQNWGSHPDLSSSLSVPLQNGPLIKNGLYIYSVAVFSTYNPNFFIALQSIKLLNKWLHFTFLDIFKLGYTGGVFELSIQRQKFLIFCKYNVTANLISIYILNNLRAKIFLYS